MDTRREDFPAADVPETWTPWPVNWSGVWVGALSALAALVIFGLSGVALGLHTTGPDARIVDWHKVFWGAVICAVLSAFFAFVIGGWIAAKIGGFTRSEPAMLHGSLAWLVAVPLLLAAAVYGGSSYLGSWYGGLGGSPAWSASAAPVTTSPAPEDRARADENRKATANAALTAVTCLLLGLIGSVLGGWMASGEPMTLTHHLRRKQRVAVGNGLSEAAAGRPLTSV
jgi:hypothetical protein